MHSHPSLVAMTTAAVTTGLVFTGLQLAPQRHSETADDQAAADLRLSPWLYTVMVLADLTVAYAPQLPFTSWAELTAIGLVLLAGLWLTFGLRLYRIGTRDALCQAEILLNSALGNFAIVLGLTATLAAPDFTHHRLLPLLLVAIGGGLLWMSLALRTQGLFYGTLILWGLAGILLKLTYFPAPSTGIIQMIIALAVWGVLWWLEHETEESLATRQTQLTARAQQRAPFTLLGKFPVSGARAYPTLLRFPLLLATIVLWALGVWHLTARLLDSPLSWSWVGAAGLSAVGAVLGAGYFRIVQPFPLAFVLGLGAWLATTSLIGLSQVSHLAFSSASYSLLVWFTSVLLLKHPLTLRLAYLLHLAGQPHTIEAAVHWTAVVHCLLCVAGSLLLVGPFTPDVAVFATLVCVTLFLGITGWWYRNKVHAYLLLSVVSLATLLSYSWITLPLHTSVYTLFRDHDLGLLASVLGVMLWTSAWELSLQKTRLNSEILVRAHQLYHRPLCHAAVLLTVFTINQALALAWVDAAQGVNVQATVTLVLASAVLFAASSTLGHTTLQVAAVVIAALAVVWGEALLMHPETPFTLWPDGSPFSDQWLLVSFISGSLALLAYRLRQTAAGSLYALPVTWAATITYGWGLFGTTVLFVSAPLRPDLCLVLTFLLLMASLFPLVQSLTEAPIIRGFTLPLLGTACLVSASALTNVTSHLWLIALLWGFTLWSAANFALPRWNEQYRQWAVTPDTWPWFGLTAVSCGGLIDSVLNVPYGSRFALLHNAGYLLAWAAYLLLMLRHSAWPGFTWLAVFLIIRVGFLLNLTWPNQSLDLSEKSLFTFQPLSLNIGVLLWLNMLLLLVPCWRKHGEKWATFLGWRYHNLVSPLLVLPTVFFLFRLTTLASSVLFFRSLGLLTPSLATWSPLAAVGCILTLSLLHLWWHHRQTWEAHVLFAALSCTALLAWIGYVSSVFHFPFFIALWSAALYAASSLWNKYKWGNEVTEPLRRVMTVWVEPTLVAAMTALVLVPAPLPEQLLTLLILIDTAVVLGWKQQQHRWILAAGIMALVFLHDWPLLWVPFSQISFLWPWYALQMALVLWLLVWLTQRVQRSQIVPTGTSAVPAHNQQEWLVPLCSWPWRVTCGIAVIEWLLHAISLFVTLSSGDTPEWLNGKADAVAALSAAALLVAFGARQAWITQQARWMYTTAVFAGVVLFYIRLVVVGLAPASAWDTTGLMITAYLLFALYHFVRLEPLLHVVMVMPCLLFATIPFHLASPHAGLAFVAASTLYLLTYRETARSLPLYLALAGGNAALYLWIPLWAEHYNVIQLYVTPVAVSVLLLAHLHRHELKAPVLSTIRLAATTTLYVSTTSDVFLHQGLGIFLVALALSFAGILLGIAVRVRAFLYTGVASLVCNIGWQLIMLFPDQRLSQAVILLTLAVLLAGAMTWFNTQRESVLQRVRIFRSDLETWA
ncbi:MAG: hypothetical protein FJ147_20705 [Deltaproteobacteria bacterium]|nr:hypothetical protein [Deltaproteobacteria bacterium]